MVVLEKSRLLLLFLLLHNSHGMDGCPGDENTLGSQSSRCGDVCASQYELFCTCGNTTFHFHEESKWCCGTNCTAGVCVQWKYGHKEGDWKGWCTEWLPPNCPTGVALQLNQSCEGRCNFYVEDGSRNNRSPRSHIPACVNRKICVKEGEGGHETGIQPFTQTICAGDSSCEGELDWCREEERKKEKCPWYGDGYGLRCLRFGSNKKWGNTTKSIPGLCFDKTKVRDGVSHCLDRSDEDPFRAAAKESIIDFASLKSCTSNVNGRFGLECNRRESIEGSSTVEGSGSTSDREKSREGSSTVEGSGSTSTSSNCAVMAYWCKHSWKCPVLGADIRTTNPTLCANISFWRQLTCGKTDFRCRAGNSGQCVDPRWWALEGHKDSCKDGSDLYRPLKQPIETEEASGDKEDSTEAKDGQHSQPQMWKTKPISEWEYDKIVKGERSSVTKSDIEQAGYVKDSSTGVWMIPESNPFKVPAIVNLVDSSSLDNLEKGPELWDNGWNLVRKEEWVNFYSSDDYAKDETTNQIVSAPRKKTCEAYNGFVCKVKLYDYDNTADDCVGMKGRVHKQLCNQVTPNLWLNLETLHVAPPSFSFQNCYLGL